MWSGAVTKNSARVRALATGGVDTVLRLSTSPDLSRPTEIKPAFVDTGVHTFDLTNLTPATRYYYAIDDAAIGSVKTFPDGHAPLRIAFGSCADTGSTSPVFSTLADKDPDLLLHLGDLHYENIQDNDVIPFRRAIKRVFASPVQASLYENTPIAYVWDDHDFGGNDADASSPSRHAALRAYREMVPHYPLSATGTIHQAFTIGGVRIVMLDGRGERVPGHTMLGIRQENWLFEELERSSKTHQLVIIASAVTWIGDHADTWGGYPRQRERIARFIRERGIENLIMISGDAHMTAFDDGRNNRYAGSKDTGFPIFLASSFDRPGNIKGGPYSGGCSEGRGRFGLIEVANGQATVSACDLQDRNMMGMVVPLRS